MTDDQAPPPETIPPDDLSRHLTVARPDQDQSLPHIGLVGDTYTILLGGQDTAGKYTLIDMHVPPGGGPPPHRHDFEEMFTVLEGEVEVTCRGEKMTAHAGETVNVPANAPHAFANATDAASRLLCLCAPAGQDEFFTLVGRPWRRGRRRHPRSMLTSNRPSSRSRSSWRRNTRPSCSTAACRTLVTMEVDPGTGVVLATLTANSGLVPPPVYAMLEQADNDAQPVDPEVEIAEHENLGI